MLTGTVCASESTTYCYTISVDGYWIRTQDAYMAGGILLMGEGMTAPEDLFVKNELIYVADSGNGRIIVYDTESRTAAELGQDILKSPTGLFVTDDRIFVADYGHACVFVLNKSFEIIQKIERPQNELFGKDASFKPQKVLVDSGGNIYVVSDGSFEGMLQFSSDGVFIGYYGVNQASITPIEALQDIFFTSAQKDSRFRRIPKTIRNAAVGQNDLVYSVTRETVGNAIAKHNMAGENILSSKGALNDERNFVDVALSPDGFIYALSDTGLIYEYDNDGNLAFSFGGRAVSSERNGLFTVASALDIDSDGIIYVLDKERALIQVFYPTDFAAKTHRAVLSLKSGDYDESKAIWEELLKLNGMSRLAHNGYGRTLFRERDFEAAAGHFKLAQNRKNYSEAFWEIRNGWLTENLTYLFAALILMVFIFAVLAKLNRKKGIFKSIKERIGRLKGNRLFDGILFTKHVLRHPIDSFYYIKKGEKGSVRSANILYAAGLIVFLCDMLLRSFIWRGADAKNTSVSEVTALFVVPVLLWSAGSYMVSAVNNGEGSFRQVYIATAYSLSPYIILTPAVILLTYVLTLNEAFIVSFSSAAIIAYTGVTFFFGIREIHNYSAGETIKNILITLFFILIAIIAFAILYLLWGQIIEFVTTIFGEVGYRAG